MARVLLPVCGLFLLLLVPAATSFLGTGSFESDTAGLQRELLPVAFAAEEGGGDDGSASRSVAPARLAVSGEPSGPDSSVSGEPPSRVGSTVGAITLTNPLKVDSIPKLLQLILDIILIFATPIIVFFIIYSGFLFVTAQGNDAQLTKAKTALLWTVIGGVIVLGANVLLDVLIATVKSLQQP